MRLIKRDKFADEMLFHHRYPTSTRNVRNACHPFSTKDTFEHNYVGVHNGVLYNEDVVKETHDKLGFKYVSVQDNGQFNDSEALVYDVARFLEGQVEELSVAGTIAFIVIQRDKNGMPLATYFGRNNGNPLHMKLTDASLTLSSEGEGVLIDTNTLYRFDHLTYKLTTQTLTIPTYDWSDYSKSYSYTGYGNGYTYDPYADEDEYTVLGSDYQRQELLSLVDYDIEQAIELGKDTLKNLEERYMELEVKELNDNVTNEELNEFYALDDEIIALRRALLDLAKERNRRDSLPAFRNPSYTTSH